MQDGDSIWESNNIFTIFIISSNDCTALLLFPVEDLIQIRGIGKETAVKLIEAAAIAAEELAAAEALDDDAAQNQVPSEDESLDEPDDSAEKVLDRSIDVQEELPNGSENGKEPETEETPGQQD